MRVTITDAQELRGFAPRADKGAVREAPQLRSVRPPRFPLSLLTPFSPKGIGCMRNRFLKRGRDARAASAFARNTLGALGSAMADTLTKQERSERMSRIGAKDTKPS